MSRKRAIIPASTMSPLDKGHPVEAEIAKKLLDDFFGDRGALATERRDALEMRICEALVKSYEQGLEHGHNDPGDHGRANV